MKLTPQQREHFSAMESTYLTPGWTLLSTGWEAERDNLPEMMFFNAKSYEDMQAARVRHGLLVELIDLPKMMERQKQEIDNMPEPDELE